MKIIVFKIMKLGKKKKSTQICRVFLTSLLRVFYARTFHQVSNCSRLIFS